jgi:hypothetical protein
MDTYLLTKSNKPTKKWMVITPDGRKTIHFGDNKYQDYTQSKNKDKRDLYELRHQKREDWTKNGINTPGFWAYWALWKKPDFNDALRNIEKKFKIHIFTI